MLLPHNYNYYYPPLLIYINSISIYSDIKDRKSNLVQDKV